MPRVRLDQRMVDLGLAPTRARAQALVLAGEVLVAEQLVTKAGHAVDEAAEIRLKSEPMPWVSRGALKLIHALDRYAIDVTDRDGLDVGASTGGFTDVLLARGARRVCAVDVGTNQLDWKLRSDPRVTVMERFNARHLRRAELPFAPEVLVCDVSFISLDVILPRLVEVGAERGRHLVCLVKPQFEVEKGEVGEGGVVREEAKRLGAVEKIRASAAALGCAELGWCESPIRGPAGNVEYLLVLSPPRGPSPA